MDYSFFSEKWRIRFEFFDAHGAPNSPEYKAAYKALSFKQRLKVQVNFIAFFFGPIYWFVLGMWKKALTMLGLVVLIGAAVGLLGLPSGIEKGLGMGLSAMYAVTTNYSYYLAKVKQQDSWNPFAGMF